MADRFIVQTPGCQIHRWCVVVTIFTYRRCICDV